MNQDKTTSLDDILKYVEYKFSGTLSFYEFLMYLDMMCHGSLEDRIDWLFRLYDTNRDGVISRDEMYRVAEAVMSMMSTGDTDSTQFYDTG